MSRRREAGDLAIAVEVDKALSADLRMVNQTIPIGTRHEEVTGNVTSEATPSHLLRIEDFHAGDRLTVLALKLHMLHTNYINFFTHYQNTSFPKKHRAKN